MIIWYYMVFLKLVKEGTKKSIINNFNYKYNQKAQTN